MNQYRVELTVDMNAEKAENAALYVAEMAEGWSYIVTNLLSGEKVFVHLDNDDNPIVEPFSESLE